jgi:hypothetical protein
VSIEQQRDFKAVSTKQITRKSSYECFTIILWYSVVVEEIGTDANAEEINSEEKSSPGAKL